MASGFSTYFRDTFQATRQRFYERFLKEFRDQEPAVLEIGVLRAQSLCMWAEYFTRGRIVGIDIDPEAKAYERERVSIEIIDQSDAPALIDVALKYGPFTLVLDDGSHIWDHQINALRALLPFVKPGGYYILEDMDTSYGTYIPSYSGTGGISAAKYVQKVADYMIADEALDISVEDDEFIRRFARRLEFIAFSRRTCVIRMREFA